MQGVGGDGDGFVCKVSIQHIKGVCIYIYVFPPAEVSGAS